MPACRPHARLFLLFSSALGVILMFLNGQLLFQERRERRTSQLPSVVQEALVNYSSRRSSSHSTKPTLSFNSHNTKVTSSLRHDNIVTFIPPESLLQLDAFSATWWQSKSRFLKHINMDPNCWFNQLVEGAVFEFTSRPGRLRRWNDLRMTTDWLQFAVEHTSKTWKQSGWRKESETIPYKVYVDKLLSFAKRRLSSTYYEAKRISAGSTGMSETIALVALMPYGSSLNVTRGQVMTVANLVATLTALIRVECGRVLLVVEQNDWGQTLLSSVLATKLLLKRSIPFVRDMLHAALVSNLTVGSKNRAENIEFQVAQTEVALVFVNCSLEEGLIYQRKNSKGRVTKLVRMLPKAGLIALQRALVNHGEVREREHAHQWLGSNLSRWRYVYLTEPDTLLNTNRDALLSIRHEIDKGAIAVPHRLQPVPHESDLPGFTDDQRHVLLAEGTLANVQTLSANDKCCDLPAHPGVKPKCGTFWFLCGFSEKNKSNHFRFDAYGLMRLEDGSGITSLAGGCNGRQCIPQKSDEPCHQILGSAQTPRMHFRRRQGTYLNKT